MYAQPSESKRAENLAGLSAEAQRELQIGQEGWEILTSAAGAFYGESSAENLRCNEICRKRMEKFLAESRLEFLKTAGVSACWNADRRGYDHSSGVKA